MKRPPAVLLALSSLLLTCTSGPTGPKATLSPPRLGGAYDPPAVRSFPSRPDVVQGWIDRLDEGTIRAHGWDLWESINTPTPDGQPIWEGWHSGYELFELAQKQPLHRRTGVKDFEIPVQFFHTASVDDPVPVSAAERPLAFNRFSPSLTQYIADHRLNQRRVLDSTYQAMVARRVPIADRQIQTSADTVDALSVALKPVFQFIPGDGPTAVPYWRGISAQTPTNLQNPEPYTWRQCVVIDPTGRLQPGTTARMPCNDEPPQDWPVVALDRFFSLRITEAQAAAFSQFAADSGDDLGASDRGDRDSVLARVRAGNVALLMAMHVTGKEINKWTWQTFWWSPTPDAPPYGHDRPASIGAPWDNYVMNTAYYMVTPERAGRNGEPLISFNPYLETNLKGTLQRQVGSRDSIHWTGAISNCMSCHRLAANGGERLYVPNGYVDPGDVRLFDGKLKTDFLWSIPMRAWPVKPRLPKPVPVSANQTAK